MIKGFYIFILSQHILKIHEKRTIVSVLVSIQLKVDLIFLIVCHFKSVKREIIRKIIKNSIKPFKAHLQGGFLKCVLKFFLGWGFLVIAVEVKFNW